MGTVMARRAPTPGGRATLAPLPSSETIQRRGTTPSPPSTAREWQRCEDRSATSPHCARCSPTLLLTPLRRPLVHHRTTPTRPARHLSHTSLHRTSAQPRHANSTPLCHIWVDATVWLLAIEEILHELLDLGDTCGTTHKYNLI